MKGVDRDPWMLWGKRLSQDQEKPSFTSLEASYPDATLGSLAWPKFQDCFWSFLPLKRVCLPSSSRCMLPDGCLANLRASFKVKG